MNCLALDIGSTTIKGAVLDLDTGRMTSVVSRAFPPPVAGLPRCAAWLDAGRNWNSVVLSAGLTQSVPVLKSRIQEHFDAPLRESIGEEALMGLLYLARKEHALAPAVEE